MDIHPKMHNLHSEDTKDTRTNRLEVSRASFFISMHLMKHTLYGPYLIMV